MVTFRLDAEIELQSEPHCKGVGFCMTQGKDTEIVWFEDRAAMKRFALALLHLLSKKDEAYVRRKGQLNAITK